MKRAANDRIRAGLIGVGNWARYGHIPALRSLEEQYEITAVSSRQIRRAEELAKGLGIPHVFGDHRQLIKHPDIDLVVVLPPAPEHAALSRLAIEAGKDVYCEWPLTTTTADSTHLLSMSETAKVRHAGLQRRMGPSARYLRDLLAQGYIGTLRSVRMHVSIEYFGPQRPPSLEWSLPAANFSHLLSIYGGHFFDLLFHIAGTPKTVSAITAVQFPTLTLSRTGESFPTRLLMLSCPGAIGRGGLYSVQIEAGKHNNTGLQIDFTGTDGGLKVSNTKAFGNVADNLIEGARKGQKQLEVLTVPPKYQLTQTSSLDASVRDLVHLYAAFAHPNGETYQAPSFDDAVRMHRFIAAVMKASDTGVTQQID